MTGTGPETGPVNTTDNSNDPSGRSRSDLSWVDTAVTDGSAAEPGDQNRSAVFTAVRADPTGPVLRRLIALATDRTRPAAVRLAAVGLLDQSASGLGRQPLLVAAALSALRDPAPDVRSAAAWLLVTAGGTTEARTGIDGTSDPVGPVDPATRIALAAAVSRPWLHVRYPEAAALTASRLSADRDPSVRLVGGLLGLRVASSEERPGMDTRIRADLATGLPPLAAAVRQRRQEFGVEWGLAHQQHDDDEGCCALAADLVAGTALEARVGLWLARSAFRRWRTAPARLASAITPLLAPGRPAALRLLATETLCCSLTATRAAADALAEQSTDAVLDGTVAIGLGGIGDERALPAVVRLLDADRAPLSVHGPVAALASRPTSGPLLVPALRRVLVRGHSPLAARHLAACGTTATAALPELLAGPYVTALGELGPAAAAAVPLLRRLVADEPKTSPDAALALARISGDRGPLDAHLADRPVDLRRGRPEVFSWLDRHGGGLTERQSAQLRHLFTARPGTMQARSALAWWQHAGPDAAPELLAALPHYVEDDFLGHHAMAALAAMGGGAAPVLPVLEALIGRRTRVPVQDPDPDFEMRADERLLATAVHTRTQILEDHS